MEMLSADPIGTAQKIDTVDQYVQSKIAEWKQFKEENNPKWWQFWKNGTVLCVAVRFLIDALDYLIDHVETVISSGPDKKAVVLAAIAVLYDLIRGALVIVVVAGMEGALPSVVGGLVDKPVIAVPTSVGYGASFQGVAALLAMLNSCAGGVSVVNIDNGFGAGYIASMINKLK